MHAGTRDPQVQATAVSSPPPPGRMVRSGASVHNRPSRLCRAVKISKDKFFRIWQTHARYAGWPFLILAVRHGAQASGLRGMDRGHNVRVPVQDHVAPCRRSIHTPGLRRDTHRFGAPGTSWNNWIPQRRALLPSPAHAGSGADRICELAPLLSHWNALARGSGLPPPACGRGAGVRSKQRIPMT